MQLRFKLVVTTMANNIHIIQMYSIISEDLSNVIMNISPTDKPWLRGEISDWNWNLLTNVFTYYFYIVFELCRNWYDRRFFGNCS